MFAVVSPLSVCDVYLYVLCMFFFGLTKLSLVPFDLRALWTIFLVRRVRVLLFAAFCPDIGIVCKLLEILRSMFGAGLTKYVQNALFDVEEKDELAKIFQSWLNWAGIWWYMKSSSKRMVH